MKLSDIKKALQPVLAHSMDRGSFKIGDVIFQVRTTLPVEDNRIQKFAVEEAEDDEGNVTTLPYIDAYRNYLIATCITHVGDLHVEHQEFLETGDFLADGTPVRVARVEALYRLVCEWGREFQILAFLKIYDLTSILEMRQKGMINYDPVDLDTEVRVLEGRIQQLKKRIEERQEQSMNSRKIDMDLVRNHHLLVEDPPEAIETPSEEAPPPESPPLEQPSQRQSLIPTSVAPPPEVADDPAPPAHPRYDLGSHSSIYSTGSEEEAIQQEEARIAMRRQAALAREQEDAGLVLDRAVTGTSNPRFRK